MWLTIRWSWITNSSLGVLMIFYMPRYPLVSLALYTLVLCERGKIIWSGKLRLESNVHLDMLRGGRGFKGDFFCCGWPMEVIFDHMMPMDKINFNVFSRSSCSSLPSKHQPCWILKVFAYAQFLSNFWMVIFIRFEMKNLKYIEFLWNLKKNASEVGELKREI